MAAATVSLVKRNDLELELELGLNLFRLGKAMLTSLAGSQETILGKSERDQVRMSMESMLPLPPQTRISSESMDETDFALALRQRVFNAPNFSTKRRQLELDIGAQYAHYLQESVYALENHGGKAVVWVELRLSTDSQQKHFQIIQIRVRAYLDARRPGKDVDEILHYMEKEIAKALAPTDLSAPMMRYIQDLTLAIEVAPAVTQSKFQYSIVRLRLRYVIEN